MDDRGIFVLEDLCQGGVFLHRPGQTEANDGQLGGIRVMMSEEFDEAGVVEAVAQGDGQAECVPCVKKRNNKPGERLVTEVVQFPWSLVRLSGPGAGNVNV